MDEFEDSTVKGLYYVPNFLSDKEQKEISKYLRTTKKWNNIGKNTNSRRVMHFGYNYAYDRSGIKKVEDMPKYFIELVTKERINSFIKGELLTEKMDQLIINEYKPGQGIYHHIDHVKYFGSIIICITVGSGIGMEFIKSDDSNQKKTIYVQPGSLYIMSGDARYKWKHGIRKVQYDNGKKRGTRYSLTYRTVKT